MYQSTDVQRKIHSISVVIKISWSQEAIKKKKLNFLKRLLRQLTIKVMLIYIDLPIFFSTVHFFFSWFYFLREFPRLFLLTFLMNFFYYQIVVFKNLLFFLIFFSFFIASCHFHGCQILPALNVYSFRLFRFPYFLFV